MLPDSIHAQSSARSVLWPCSALLAYVLLCFVCGLLFAGRITAQPSDQGLKVHAVDAPTAVFGGTETTMRFDVESPQPAATTIGWSLSVHHRTIARGQAALPASGAGPRRLSIPLQFPAAKPGVSISAQLQLQQLGTADGQSFSWTLPITIFSEDPFWERSAWLKQLNITLYDPEGQTAECFERARIPFELARTQASFAASESGLMIVGEGIDWESERGLAETLFAAAAASRPVLCLAPNDGMLLLPPLDQPKGLPAALLLRDAAILPELDKRLQLPWLGSRTDSLARFTLAPDRNDLTLRLTNTATGWCWADIRYPAAADKPTGRLVICGFRLLEEWPDRPEPRFLLARVFELLDNQAAPAEATAEVDTAATGNRLLPNSADHIPSNAELP